MTQENDRLVPGQKFTGRSGFGPNLLVEKIDLEKGEVHSRYVPTDPNYPVAITEIGRFCRQYRLVDKF